MTAHTEHLVLITDRAAGEQVLAAWYRALPEDDLALITVRQGNWKSDVVYTCTARSDYLQVLIEIVDETVPDPRARYLIAF